MTNRNNDPIDGILGKALAAGLKVLVAEGEKKVEEFKTQLEGFQQKAKQVVKELDEIVDGDD